MSSSRRERRNRSPCAAPIGRRHLPSPNGWCRGELPADLHRPAAAGHFVLQFLGLRVPANRTGELEVACIDSTGASRPVASLPFIALSRDATGMTERESAVVALPPTADWGCFVGEATKVKLQVRP